jgi:hypothetical protein
VIYDWAPIPGQTFTPKSSDASSQWREAHIPPIECTMPFALSASRLSSIRLTCILIVMIGSLPLRAQQGPQKPLPASQLSIAATPTSPPTAARNLDSVERPHQFLDKTNILLFSGIVVFRVLDYTSTRNMLARGREERLIPDDVVNNNAGFASLEAAGAATSIGISYLLHRTGHHKLERWLSVGHIAVTGFGAARNYALESRHR